MRWTLGNFVDMSFEYSSAADFESIFVEQLCFEGREFVFGMRFNAAQILCDYFDSDSLEVDENFCWNILQSYVVVGDESFDFENLTGSVFLGSSLRCVLPCGKVWKNG